MDLVFILMMLATMLGALTIVAVTVTRCLDVVRQTDDARHRAFSQLVTAQAVRISDLENRLNAHSWSDYAQLQNHVSTSGYQMPPLFAAKDEPDHVPREDLGITPEDFANWAGETALDGPTIG